MNVLRTGWISWIATCSVAFSCATAKAEALDAGAEHRLRVAQLAQGQFQSSSDHRALERAMAKSFGAEYKIENPDADGFRGDGEAFDQFGMSVALSGETAIVGAPFDDIGAAADQGSAYVFVRSGTDWTLQSKLVAGDGMASDRFGVSVALSGEYALIGATGVDGASISDQGAAYVFLRTGTVWSQQAKLTASDAAAFDEFGLSVALESTTAVVGSWTDDVGTNPDQGSAYVFTRSGTNWFQQAKLTANDGGIADTFGFSVALSGNTAVIGAVFDDVGAVTNQGSAYVFVRIGANWNQQARLSASNGAQDDRFGISVAVNGNTALVGATLDDVGGTNQGSAFVFVRSGATWTQQAQLTANDGAADDRMGTSVALNGDTALVGASFDDFSAANQGSAYVFVRVGTSWSQQAKLSTMQGTGEDRFGVSVALGTQTALIGANFSDPGLNPDQGRAHVFVRSGVMWTSQASLSSGDGVTNDQFAASIAIDDDTALIGVPRREVGGNPDQGAVYVFLRDGADWIYQALLTANDGAIDDQFGSAVAIHGDTAVVGALRHDLASNQDAGAAYVFTRTGTAWTQQAKLTSANPAFSGTFGKSVALHNATALVGAEAENAARGAVYVFVRSGITWNLQATLTASDAAQNDRFGSAVAIHLNTALVGAYLDDDGARTNRGSVYEFERNGALWTETGKLLGIDGAAGDQFGQSVAMVSNLAVVGAPLDDVGANVDQGSAFLFDRPGGAGIWTQRQQFTAAGGAANDQFGTSVALGDDTVLVGAPLDDVAASVDQGSVHVFVKDGLSWTGQPVLAASDGAPNDQFGAAVAFDGDGVQASSLVGAPWDDSTGAIASADVGSIHFYRGRSDLSISITNNTSQLLPGDLVVYDILIGNAGPYPANAATLSNLVPAAITNVTWTCSTVGGSALCRVSNGSGNNIVQLLDLPRGGALRFQVVGTVNAAPGTSISSTATVTALDVNDDINLGNNTATDLDLVVTEALFANGFE